MDLKKSLQTKALFTFDFFFFDFDSVAISFYFRLINYRQIVQLFFIFVYI